MLIFINCANRFQTCAEMLLCAKLRTPKNINNTQHNNKHKMALETPGIVNKIIKNILEQCRIMDKLKINKKEFHKPIKHIIVYKNKPVMIDFERCYYAEKPKNVTQFCQFISSGVVMELLEKKAIKFEIKGESEEANKIIEKELDEINEEEYNPSEEKNIDEDF